MRRHYKKVVALAISATAKDTYILFIGNIISAFFSFVFTLLVARGLSVSEFGVFSAVVNLVTIIASFSDIGISSGLINFIAEAHAKKDYKSISRYVKSALVLKLLTVSILAIIVLIFSSFVSNKLLATSDIRMAYWVSGLSITLIFWAIFPSILQAQKKFVQSVAVDLSLVITRVLVVLLLIVFGGLTFSRVLGAFTAASLLSILAGFMFIGTGFIFIKVRRKQYVKLLKFSGWLGVNKMISSISGKIDVQMLAAVAGATVTGYYSISSKLALFIVVLASSFSAVLAPRLASFGNKNKEKTYIKKASLVLIPIILGIIVWIVIAEPFITILFGQKYLPSVPIFKALAASMIPFILTAPAVPAIIYAMKKPVYIGAFSFFQIAAIISINYLLIPKIGAFAPTVAFGVVHTILAIYVWAIVIRYYRKS